MTTRKTNLKCPNDNSEWLGIRQKIIIDASGSTWDILSNGIPERLQLPRRGAEDHNLNLQIRKFNNDISQQVATAVLYIRDLTEGTKLESMV